MPSAVNGVVVINVVCEQLTYAPVLRRVLTEFHGYLMTSVRGRNCRTRFQQLLTVDEIMRCSISGVFAILLNVVFHKLHLYLVL